MNRLRDKEGLILETFDRRTLANMEVALERALQRLARGREEHLSRQHVAKRILECAKAGDKTLGGLTKAGYRAATEISETNGADVPQLDSGPARRADHDPPS
jgi:hypothetical protein